MESTNLEEPGVDQFFAMCPKCGAGMTPTDENDLESKPWHCHECGFNEPK